MVSRRANAIQTTHQRQGSVSLPPEPERHDRVRPAKELSITASRNHHVLAPVTRPPEGHGRGLGSRGKRPPPELSAALDVERTQRMIERRADEDDPAGSGDRAAKIDRSERCRLRGI